MRATKPSPQSDEQVLAELNDGYIRSVQNSDAAWFEAHLAPDFVNSNPDGTLSDRAAFIAFIAKPVTIRNLAIEDVRIRLFADMALIHARTTYTLPDGSTRAGRYTDIWMRQGSSWKCVAAHVTRG